VLEWRREFAGGEGVEGAKLRVEFGDFDAALAVEPAEEVGSGTISFERIAFEATRNQVAVGVAATFDAGEDVVEALNARVDAHQAIKAAAAFAEVDGIAQGTGFEEVEDVQVGGVEVGGAGAAGGIADGDAAGAGAANFIGQAHLDDVAGFAAMDEAESAENDEAADGFAHGSGADADAASEPGHREAELELAFEAAVADEMRIDGAVGDGEAQPGEEKVLELYPEAFDVQFLAFHRRILEGS